MIRGEQRGKQKGQDLMFRNRKLQLELLLMIVVFTLVVSPLKYRVR